MFTQWFINVHLKHDLGLESNFVSRKTAQALEHYYNRVINKFDEVMKNFRYVRKRHNLHHVAAKAGEIMNMANHYFGEGWLIVGDMAAFADDGINNVICLQPFGCIANHIVARGMEKPLKDKYPKLNVAYLDIDSGVSLVNLHNRIHLLLKNARESV